MLGQHPFKFLHFFILLSPPRNSYLSPIFSIHLEYFPSTTMESIFKSWYQLNVLMESHDEILSGRAQCYCNVFYDSISTCYKIYTYEQLLPQFDIPNRLM